jgi:hypothetical protein
MDGGYSIFCSTLVVCWRELRVRYRGGGKERACWDCRKGFYNGRRVKGYWDLCSICA